MKLVQMKTCSNETCSNETCSNDSDPLVTVILVIGAIIGLIYLCRKGKKSSGTTLHTSVDSTGFENSLSLFVINF